jgi:hypothetical protein
VARSALAGGPAALERQLALAFALLQEAMPALDRLPATPVRRTMRAISTVALVFSCLSPQFSIELVAVYISTGSSIQHGRASLERSMSYRNAAASCQSTVAYPIRQGITRHFLAHSGATLVSFAGIC